MLYYTLLNISQVSDDETHLIKKKIEKHFSASSNLKRKESVLSKALLCYVLKTKFGITDFTVDCEKNGKPFIVGSNLQFNLSHSGDYVLCLCGNSKVGCDIQEIKLYNPKIVERFFCSNETKLFEDNEDKDLCFTSLWALKESALKFSGEGIAGGLDRFDFSKYYKKRAFESYGLYFFVTELSGYVIGICSEGKKILQLKADIKDITNIEF